MLSAKRIAILSGMILGSSWILGGCGNSNNLIPANQLGGAPGTVGTAVGQCAYGMAYYPGAYGNTYGNPYGGGYGGYGGCTAGYSFNGSQCICSTSYYNNGACPPGM